MTLDVKRIRKVVILLLTNVLLTLLLLELAGLCVYYVKHDALFYGRARQTPVAETADTTQVPPSMSKHVLQPYLGYIYRPSLSMSRFVNEDWLN